MRGWPRVALGIGCMVAELFLPTFGTLGVGGIVAFAFGAVMLINTDVPGFGVPVGTVVALAGQRALPAGHVDHAAARDGGRW